MEGRDIFFLLKRDIKDTVRVRWCYLPQLESWLQQMFFPVLISKRTMLAPSRTASMAHAKETPFGPFVGEQPLCLRWYRAKELDRRYVRWRSGESLCHEGFLSWKHCALVTLLGTSTVLCRLGVGRVFGKSFPFPDQVPSVPCLPVSTGGDVSTRQETEKPTIIKFRSWIPRTIFSNLYQPNKSLREPVEVFRQ